MVGRSLDKVLTMKELQTKIRGYGWYCTNCKSHKDVSKVDVVKIVRDNYIAIVCPDCYTELVDCFVLNDHPLYPHNCDNCEDKFKCFTRADAVMERPMVLRPQHEIKTSPIANEIMAKIEGVRSYTGIYNDKLEMSDFCEHPEREDCNHSWMRANYRGSKYMRCRSMKYDVTKKEWYCVYGRAKRG